MMELTLQKMPGRNFQDRQQASVDAKAKMLERFKARPGEDDPEVQRQREERLAIAAARAEREEIKRLAKLEAERIAAEKAAIEKAEREEAERIEAEAREKFRKEEEARLIAERPRKSLMDAVQYMQQRQAGKRR